MLMCVEKALIIANLAGFASFLLSDMELLQGMGYEVTFAANGNVLKWEDTRARLDDLGVSFVQIDFDSKNPAGRENIRAYRQLKRLISEQQYQVIHCHTPITGILTRLAARKVWKAGTKVIYTTHGFTFTSYTSRKTWLVYRTLESIFSRLCDAIITINREDYDNARDMHCPKVFYIHGVGADTQKYQNVDIDREAYRSSLGVGQDDVMVLSVGELSHRKNHRLVIEALALLPDKDRYVFVLCGTGVNGGTAKELEQLAAEKHVRLKLLGFRYDIPEITCCSDVGVIPSIREGLGMAGIQSIAAGVPVVGTNVQGIRDYVVDGETGYLCGAFDAPAAADRISRLAEMDQEERTRMRMCCVEKAKAFDQAISRQEMRNIYQQILRK